MQGCGWLPLTLSGNTSGRFLCCFGRHTKGQGVKESQNAVTFYESECSKTGDVAAVLAWSLLSPSPFFLPSRFFFFIRSPCTSHSLSSHPLGLCKYCHSEILRALIDCGWGLIIRASYKDIFHKIDATKRETKSLQWSAPLFFFFITAFFSPPQGKYLFSLILPPLSFSPLLPFLNHFILYKYSFKKKKRRFIGYIAQIGWLTMTNI